MKYILKNNESDANSIIDGYLSFAKSQPWYRASELYRSFRGSRGKHDLIDQILLPEQEHLCCYCQMHIADHTDSYATIEHIIRQSTPNAAAMERYFKPEYIGLNQFNVCHSDDYVAGHSLPGQYPHRVAYHNFAIACQECNSNRGHQEIDPPFLYPDIEQETTYNLQTGEVNWNGDPVRHDPMNFDKLTEDKLHLNRPLLKAIRTVWFYGSKHPTQTYSTPDTVTTIEERNELVYRAFGEALSASESFTVEDLNSFLSLLTEHFWNITLKYKYFASVS